MKSALINCPVSKEAECDTVFATVFRGERHPHRQWNMCGDNGMAAVHVVFLIKKMHRTAQPTRTASYLAEKFCHAGICGGPSSKSVSMVAISGDDVIVRPRCRDDSCHDRFLSNVKVAKAANFLGLVFVTRPFFKTSN